MMNKNSIGRGVVYLYIEAINMIFSGYLYWLILSKITDPASIGLASTIIAFATIVFNIASIGVTGGVQRYIANGIAEKNLSQVQGIINSSLVITTAGVIISGIIILIFRDFLGNYFNIGFGYILLSIVLVTFMVFADLLRAIIIPSLKVKVITIASILSTLARFSVTFVVVYLGFDIYGVILGFLISYLLSTVIFAFAIRSKIYSIDPGLKIFVATKEILIASTTFWIPSIITTIGSQLGTISVFIVNGSGNAGVYFIAFSIVYGITVITSVLLSIAYPTISTIKDGKKRATWRLIKLSLLLTIPVSNVLLLYPVEVLSLFGSGYAPGSSTLQILSLSSLPICVSTGIGVLIYSYGNNRKFLLLGLVTSIPRALLYFVFVPFFGGEGAALSFLVGSITGAIVSLWYAKNMKFKLFYKQILTIFMIPIIITLPLKLLEVNTVFSIVIILLLSYLVFVALRLINSQDTEDILTILPISISKYLSKILPSKASGENENKE
jgi:O-antigen/teichoic acid export membrane protein